MQVRHRLCAQHRDNFLPRHADSALRVEDSDARRTARCVRHDEACAADERIRLEQGDKLAVLTLQVALELLCCG